VAASALPLLGGRGAQAFEVGAPGAAKPRMGDLIVLAGLEKAPPAWRPALDREPEQVIAPTYPPRARSVFLPGGSPVFDKWVPSFSAGARITADVDVPNGRAQGILCALGDRTSGFAFYVKDDSLVFAMSAQGRDARIAAGLPPLSGHHALTCVLAPEGEYMRFTLELDGRPLGEARQRVSVPPLWQFGGSGLCLGYDRPLSVTDEYEPPFPWSGALRSLVVEVPPEQPPDVAAEVRATLKVE
jgi:arylsulfatase